MENELSNQGVFNSRKYSSLVWNQLVQPGKLLSLPELPRIPVENCNQASIFLALDLLGAGGLFGTIGHTNPQLFDYLASVTAASVGEISRADVVFINGELPGNEIRNGIPTSFAPLKTGVTLLIDVDELSTVKYGQALKLTLLFPDTKETDVYVSGLSPAVLERVRVHNRDIAAAPNLMLTDKENNFLYIPSTLHFSWEPRLWLHASTSNYPRALR